MSTHLVVAFVVVVLTALALAPGALNTGMPSLLSLSTGILFTPAPARPTALRLFGISMSCILKERSRIPSGSFMSADTWNLSVGSFANPSDEMLLSVRILYMVSRCSS